MRHRPPILTVLQFAIGAFISWQVYRAQAASDAANPLMAVDEVIRAIMYVFLGTLAIFALNILYPLAAWGVGKLRERQETWSPKEPFVAAERDTPVRQDRHCPNCGASLFDDAPACPWCGHPLGESSPGA